MKRTYVAIVLDKSISMFSIREPTIEAFNGMLKTIQDRATEGGETRLMLVVFADKPRIEVQPMDPSRFLPLAPYNYNPGGSTALFDAIGVAVDALNELPGGGDPETSFLIVAITDGEENCSVTYDKRKLVILIDRLQETNRWSFAFNVPRGHRNAAINYGIPVDNIREWEQTPKGAETMRVETQSGLTNYFASRAAGATATRSFYEPVTTDLSKVKAKTLATKLADVSGHFKSYEVKVETDVKGFVEAHTRKPYVIGQAYYLLMKPERVQPTKAVLIVEKGKPQIYGGQAARELIGLSGDKPQRANPGNHANYDVFIQSKSTNRKLPRGTRLLIDVAQTQSMTPTWSAVNQ